LAEELIVIGGGLAGSEAAWQAAQFGCSVKLFEMRPAISTGAHISPYLAELVCSNSLGSNFPDRASGLLKAELRILGSLLVEIADAVSVPAGGALAVDRERFSRMVSQRLEEHPSIQIIREEVQEIPDTPTILASGPLTSPALSRSIQSATNAEHLYFYDAIAPIVTQESINLQIAYKGSRYSRGNQVEGDYINCPMERDEYYAFVEELIIAERIELKDFERKLEYGVKAGVSRYFEGCLPVEILARRGRETLAFGPMRPIGLIDPRTGKRPFAVLQLRQDNLGATLFNMVGFQTNLRFSEQRRIFRMIPGLEQAEFARYGQMHRNTFVFSPALLRPSLQSKWRDDLYFAGQITGVEGYVGNIATGLLAGWNLARNIYGEGAIVLPQTTMLGALCYYITHANAADFQPMKANFGIMPALDAKAKLGQGGKRERARAYMQRSLRDLEIFYKNIQISSVWKQGTK
jgi:methylenetetrahydrofolate--tRNA-(uracil-5-)-methyltransferase